MKSTESEVSLGSRTLNKRELTGRETLRLQKPGQLRGVVTSHLTP